MIEEVMACLRAARYRSASAYLSVAKQEFCRRHLQNAPFLAAISLATAEAGRAVKRGLGPAKHTREIPFLRLAGLSEHAFKPLPDQPGEPVRTLVLACCFLLREIEAADLLIKHVSFRTEGSSLLVDFYLRVSKNDPTGSGCTRTHTCTCAATSPALCSFHAARAQKDLALKLAQDDVDKPFFPTSVRR